MVGLVEGYSARSKLLRTPWYPQDGVSQRIVEGLSHVEFQYLLRFRFFFLWKMIDRSILLKVNKFLRHIGIPQLHQFSKLPQIVPPFLLILQLQWSIQAHSIGSDLSFIVSGQHKKTRESQSITLFLQLIIDLDKFCLIYYFLFGLFCSLGELEEHSFYLLARSLQLKWFVYAFLLVRIVDEYRYYVFVEKALLGKLLGALEICHYFEEAAL